MVPNVLIEVEVSGDAAALQPKIGIESAPYGLSDRNPRNFAVSNHDKRD
jgi:hypothetical protein